MTYNLVIDAVDGERSYCITTPSREGALAFLEQYDHEGSCLSLIADATEFFNPEDIYQVLNGEQE